MATPRDTSPEAERVLIEAYRRMSPGKKWLLLGEAYAAAKALHAAGVRHRCPTATPQEIHADWLHVQLGMPQTLRIVARQPERPMQQNLSELREVLAVFTRLSIPYALGGSMASSVYGIARYTQDADVTVEPFPGKEEELAASFGPDYYLSIPAIQQANRDRSSFNVINTATGFKVDVFIRKDVAFEEMALQRRIPQDFPDAPGSPLFLQSAEDVVLFKLRWYRLGNETSDRQWTDVLGVLKVQAGKLDDAYLDHWSTVLQVADLLRRARQESGS
jgi:hypothetical protein